MKTKRRLGPATLLVLLLVPAGRAAAQAEGPSTTPTTDAPPFAGSDAVPTVSPPRTVRARAPAGGGRPGWGKDAIPATLGRLRGRVFEKGSIIALPGVVVRASTGLSAITDASGRFELTLSPGPVELAFADTRHEPLRAREKIAAGRGLTIEYRLLPLPAYRRRFETTVRADTQKDSRFVLRDEELRTLPGSLGDPFRAVTLLPGVATPLPLLPVYVVRGASPGMNGFFLDGMRVPQLFHLLVGGGVVHARLVDELEFYPGAYGASFGRFAGGVVDSHTRPARADGQHGELEVRLYDLSAALELSLPRDVRITLSGHYGYPGPLIRAIVPGVDLQYWDYQLRLDWHGLTVQALGSYDSLVLDMKLHKDGMMVTLPDEFRLTFHRVQVRERFARGPLDLEAALYGGYDEMRIFGGSGVQKLALGARVGTRLRLGRLVLSAGVDGEISRFSGSFADPSAQTAPDRLGELGDERDGVVAGAFFEGTLEIVRRRLFLTAGGRIDVYHAGKDTLLGLDPRAQLRLHATAWLSFTAGGGLYQQPPSFPVALPGLDTYALQLGLQRAIHGAVGIETRLPKTFSLGVTGYYQVYKNANDFNVNDFNIGDITMSKDFNQVITFATSSCGSPPPDSLSGAAAQITRQIDGHSYGMELLLRRREGRVTGWIAYTLSRSERIFTCGLRPADFDQTHVLNLVLQAHLPWKLMAGVRLFVASGRPVTIPDQSDPRAMVRNNDRLPPYVQLDLRLDREWIFSRWALAAFVEVVNTTFSYATFGVTYPMTPSGIRATTPSPQGFPWILPSVGVRGRF